jgi:tryptophan 2,3-dioxygenase
LKLIGHELIAAKVSIGDADLRSASKAATRINQILVQMVQSWNIFSTLSPVAYLEFRDELGSASGYQSYGYRKIEFLLGNKNAKLLHAYNTTPDVLEDLTEVLHAPSLYDEVIRQLHHSGFSIDPSSLDRDFSKPYESNDAVMKAWLQIYRNVDTHSEFYDLAERLVDIEDTFQQWRFKHLYTVQRIIGHRRGTGGSSGVPFLKKALDTCFFPELIELRTEL